MALFSATFSVIFLFGFINFSSAKKETCDIYAAVGQSLTLPFVYEGLTNTHVLRWTHNDTLIFYRQQGKLSVGKTEDVTARGSLMLKNIKPTSAGAYEAKVLHLNSTVVKTWKGRLCMMDKVSKPLVTYDCDFKSSVVNLICKVDKPEGMMFSWTLDDKTLTSETKQTLSITLVLAQLKGERTFTCGVENKVSKEKSDTVRPICKNPTPPPLLCFLAKTVVAAVAGGVSLILLLLLVIIVTCCCFQRKQRQMRVREIGELRMLSLVKREPDSISPEYETMHPTENTPPPSPKPSPRACYQNVSEPEAQPGNKPLEVSTAAEGQKPSPVPKPRMKNPQTSKTSE